MNSDLSLRDPERLARAAEEVISNHGATLDRSRLEFSRP